MYWETGLPGWMRFGPGGLWGFPSPPPYTREQEVGFLKDQAAALKGEMDAINSRIRDLESDQRILIQPQCQGKGEVDEGLG